MVKFIIVFFSLLTLFLFLNYKFSQAIRIIAYGEDEQPKEALWAFIVMIASVIGWSIDISFF